MTNPIKQAHQTLVRRLGQIVPSNGYLTDVGTRIKEGWLAELLQADDLTFPFITLQPGLYIPGSWGAGAVLTRVGRRVVGAVDGTRDDYLEQLEELYCDLVACLQVPEGVPNPWGSPGPRQVTLEPGQMFPPGEGLNAGTVLMPLHLHIHINAGRQP